MSINLVKLLVNCSEKSANIARRIRADPNLLSLLTQEKAEDANPRFVKDFKTLADVLIQETIRYYVSNEFPELENHILGEESSQFTNSLGDFTIVTIGPTQEETKSCLEKVLDGDSVASEILAEEVHKEVDYYSEDLGDIPKLPEIDYSKLGIIIDPIDATKEYIDGETVFSDFPGITSSGLDCVTVLIGVFDRETGTPLIGVINQPFHKKLSNNSYESKVFWGISTETLKANNILKSEEVKNIAIFSTSEDSQVLDKVKEKNYELAFSAGAGHKVLKVILNDAKFFLLSKGSTYKWDTCAPHAILNSLGGGILDLRESLKAKKAVNLIYSSGKANSNGIFAYQKESDLEELFSLNLSI
ncbi:INPP1 family protein [Megaselia abdita]